MKKRIIGLGILASLLVPFSVNAATASCSVYPSTVTQNGTFTVTFSGTAPFEALWQTTLSYDSSRVSKTGGTSDYNVDTDEGSSKKYTYNFRANAIGTTTFSIKAIPADVVSGTKDSASTSCSVNVISYSTPKANTTTKSSSGSDNNSTSSKDTKSTTTITNSDTNLDTTNSLDSITIDNGSLDPEFDKDTMEYSIEVENDVESINIKAEPTSSKATVEGTGTKELEEGQNKVNLVVTSESGSTRTYVLNIHRKEKNPVKVKVDGKEYTVIRKVGVLDPPNNFEETSVTIDGEKVLAYKHKKLNIVIVGLTDGNDNAWYIYNSKDKSFEKYIEFTNDSLKLLLKNVPKNKEGFKTDEIKINGQKVKAYVSKVNNNFIVVYATNLDTGKDGYYLYDKLNNSFIAYENEIYSPKVNKLDANTLLTSIKDSDFAYIYLGICIVIIILVIISISLNVKNSKLKKKIRKLQSGNLDKGESFDDDTDDDDEDEDEIDDDEKEKESQDDENDEEVKVNDDNYDTVNEEKENDHVTKEETHEENKKDYTDDLTRENGISELEAVSKLYNASLDNQNILKDDEIDDDFADLKPKKKRKRKRKNKNN